MMDSRDTDGKTVSDWTWRVGKRQKWRKSPCQAWKTGLMVGWRTTGGGAGFGGRNDDVSFAPL